MGPFPNDSALEKKEEDGLQARVYYLDKLNVELPCEGRNFSLNSQFPLLDADRNNFIMGSTVSNSIEYIQVLHYHVPIHTHIKNLCMEIKEKERRRIRLVVFTKY